MGGCNIFAEEVYKMFNLPCYMVYHEYIDYDDTGTREDGEITISKDELNRNNLDRYSSNAWNTFLSESMIKPVKKELQKYIKNKPWLNKEKVNI